MFRRALGCHWFLLVAEREADPSDDSIPLTFFRGGIIHQNAIHVFVHPVAAVVPGGRYQDLGGAFGQRRRDCCEPTRGDRTRLTVEASVEPPMPTRWFCSMNSTVFFERYRLPSYSGGPGEAAAADP